MFIVSLQKHHPLDGFEMARLNVHWMCTVYISMCSKLGIFCNSLVLIGCHRNASDSYDAPKVIDRPEMSTENQHTH